MLYKSWVAQQLSCKPWEEACWEGSPEFNIGITQAGDESKPHLDWISLGSVPAPCGRILGCKLYEVNSHLGARNFKIRQKASCHNNFSLDEDIL